MTDEREPGSGENGSDAGDGLDAWMAAHFPATPPDPTPEPPPTEPAPPPIWNPISFDELPPNHPVFPPMAEELAGIPPAAEFPPPPSDEFAEESGPSGLDALFGESRFLEYESGAATSENPFVRRPPETVVLPDGTQVSDAGAKAPARSPQTVLLWIAGSLVAVLALIALFLLGTKLPAILGPAPGALVVPTVTGSPTPTAAPLGPVAPGDYLWDELLGGECLRPFPGPWEVRYTVVDCEQPHPAQLVTRGEFPVGESGLAYPGIEALQAQINLLCTSPTVVDYSKANAYTDIQVEASYAISAEDWYRGDHFYYCFLSRSSGGDLTGTIAMPQVAPTPSPTESPSP